MGGEGKHGGDLCPGCSVNDSRCPRQSFALPRGAHVGPTSSLFNVLAGQEAFPGDSGDHGNKTQALTTSDVLSDGPLAVEGHLWGNAAAEAKAGAAAP